MVLFKGVDTRRYHCSAANHRPQTTLREGNVYTGVCLFTGESAFPQCHGQADTPPPEGRPPAQIRSTGGWYASYWNAYLFNFNVDIVVGLGGGRCEFTLTWIINLIVTIPAVAITLALFGIRLVRLGKTVSAKWSNLFPNCCDMYL